MKRFNQTALMTAIFGIMIAVAGCGSNDNGNPVGPGGPGGPGGIPVPQQPQYPNGYQPYPGGGAAMQVAFTGQNIYNSGIKIVAGEVIGSGQSTIPGTFCGFFTIGGKQCWPFANPTYMNFGLGVITIGGNAMPVGQAGSVFGQSKYEPNSGITIVLTPTNDPLHSNVSGTINLSQAFMSRNFPQGVPQIIGIAIDVHNSGSQIIDGGILIYTGRDQSGYHGAFLRM